MTFECSGNLCNCLKGNLLFGAFDHANVVSRQIHFLCQRLLAESGLFSLPANGFTQNAINFDRR